MTRLWGWIVSAVLVLVGLVVGALTLFGWRRDHIVELARRDREKAALEADAAEAKARVELELGVRSDDLATLDEAERRAVAHDLGDAWRAVANAGRADGAAPDSDPD